MFNVTDLDNVWREVERGEEVRDARLTHHAAMVRQMSASKGSIDALSLTLGEDSWPENHTFEYLSVMVPRIVYEQPRVVVTSRKEAPAALVNQLRMELEVAVFEGLLTAEQADAMMSDLQETIDTPKAVTHGLNRWVNDSEFAEVLDEVCYDYLMCWGVTVKRMDAMPGDDASDPDSRRWPVSERVSPYRFVMDPASLSWMDAAWMCHWSIEDRDDLLRQAEADPGAGWDRKAIKELTTYQHEGDGSDLNRDEVQVYQMWVRNYRKKDWPGEDEGFSGAIITFGVVRRQEGSRGTVRQMLKEPQPFWGPKHGPYTVYGAYNEPDSPWPLSPIAAVYKQVQQLNTQAVAINRNAEQYKRLIFVGGDDGSLADTVASQPDNYVVPVSSERFDRDSIVQTEFAGVSDQQLRHFQMFRERLDRMSGMDEAQRGSVTGIGTATEHAIADASAHTRVNYLQKRFADAVEHDLEGVLWYLVYEDRVSFDLGPEVGAQVGMLQPVYEGFGIPKSADDPRVEDLELELDVYSMRRTDEAMQQRRGMEAFELISKASQLMPQTPWINWKNLLQIVGDGLNIARFSDLVDHDMLQQFAQMQMQMQMGMPAGPDQQGLPPGQAMSNTDISGPQLGGKVGLMPATQQAHAAAMEDREERL